MTTDGEPSGSPCHSEAALRFQAHRRRFAVLIAGYFLGLLIPTLVFHRAPVFAWIAYASLSGACAAASLMLLSCPACHRRLPNFTVAACPACRQRLQLPIGPITPTAVVRWRGLTRMLIVLAGIVVGLTVVAGLRRAPVNLVFAGVLTAAGLAFVARHPMQRAQICPVCHSHMGQRLWRRLHECQSCGAPASLFAPPEPEPEAKSEPAAEATSDPAAAEPAS